MSDRWQRTPIANSPLSVVLTARDVGPGLEEAVLAWAGHLDGLQRPYEIILVNDGSADDTAARADALAQRLPSLRVLHPEAPRGVGAALRAGIAAARHPLLVSGTCDSQYRPEDLKRLLDAIDRVDLVTGCRSGRVAPWWWRALGALSRGFVRVLFGLSLAAPTCWPGWSGWGRRWLARWLFGVRVHDPECAFRLFRRSVSRRIPVQSEGEFAQVEILAKANFLGCLMDEVPVAHRPPGRPARQTAGQRRQYWRDLRRVLAAPDFGPATLPPEEPLPAEAPAAAEGASADSGRPREPSGTGTEPEGRGP
jgi:glycosyltransferase involved in cell wall biosynthesis